MDFEPASEARQPIPVRRWPVPDTPRATDPPASGSRPSWKGALKLGELAFDVALFAAASTSERVSFHIVNAKTGDRVHREYIDAETGKVVEHDDQVKGYERSAGHYVVLEPEEIAAAVPHSDKILHIESFVGCGDVDEIYFDRPYYLAPAQGEATEGYVLLRAGMRKAKVAAIARTVLFRRVRTVLIRPHRNGLIATTLNFDYEVRSAREAFGKRASSKAKRELLDLAQNIIKTKKGRFDPAKFDDRYDKALANLVKAKLGGHAIEAPPPVEPTKSADLLEALQMSASPKRGARAKAATTHRRSGSAARKRKPSTRKAPSKATRRR
jgi:DNA end-binding protein Ku